MSLKLQRLTRHTCLTAGAGAGKTRRLVETYLGLLSEGIAPPKIVAITFTEKAAAEMRARVVARLAELAGGQEPGPDWGRLLIQVEWAPISTIHSFCATLLREFGPAMGLDPQFSIIEAEELQDLIQKSLDEILRTEMQTSSERLLLLSAHYPLARNSGLQDRVKTLYSELKTKGLDPLSARRNSARAHQDELDKIPLCMKELDAQINRFAVLRANQLAKSKAKFTIKLDQLILFWSHAKKLLQKDFTDRKTLQRLIELSGGNWGKVNQQRQKLRETIETLVAIASIPQAAQLTDSLLSLVQDLQVRVEQDLKRRSALGFDELLLAARDLLRHNPSVLNQLRARWFALLVDEYQDVNPVQGELVGLLAGLQNYTPCDNGPDEAEIPRLLVVGDRKQSIYAFRGAEVGLYAQTMADFESGLGELEALPNNWRSAHRLVGFFNRVFPRVFSQGSRREQNPGVYVAYRQDDSQIPARTRPEPEGACVRVLQVQGDKEWQSQDWRREEAKHLGEYVAWLIQETGVDPGDIVVLFKRLTHVGLYEEGLIRAGVDYYTLRGRGYFACQEIKDVYFGLRATAYPDDELALVTWLRSGMVGLSDESLLFLAKSNLKHEMKFVRSIGEVESLPDWLPEQDRKAYDQARKFLKTMRQLSHRLAPAELIQAMVEQANYLPVLMATPGGEQKAANLRKLIEMSRQPGQAMQGGVDEFIIGLGRLVESPPMEPKAPLLGEQAHVVRLMTVHQSKGLEFPVVILADLGGKDILTNQSPPPDKNGVTTLVPRDFASNETIKNQIYSNLQQIDQAKQEAELARLFYVACTRATENLIMCVPDIAPNRQSIWAGWVHDFVIPDPEAEVFKSTELTGRFIDLNSPDSSVTQMSQTSDDVNNILLRCFHSKQLAVRSISESVSGLEDWYHCPRRYYFTRVLGLDTAILSGDYNKESFGTSLGSQVHRLLELAPLELGPAGFDGVLQQISENDESEKIYNIASGIWRTDLAEFLASVPPRNVFKEQGFTFKVTHEDSRIEMDVIGEIDLLLAHPDSMVIIDYKVSQHIDPEPYRMQLGLYALAGWRMQQKTGTPPRCGICFMSENRADLIWQDYDAGQLEELERSLKETARMIASLPLEPRLDDFQRGPACSASCALARAGLCKAE
jgi:ATP-dependent helicase/nuclease subunit A